jgi:hypothetical protein
MTDNPYVNARTIESLSLDVSDQAPGRGALLDLFPERDAIWLKFLLVPNGDDVDVLLHQTEKAGLYVGKIGARNRDKLAELMNGQPAVMRGLIEWASSKPKIRFIPPYSLR